LLNLTLRIVGEDGRVPEIGDLYVCQESTAEPKSKIQNNRVAHPEYGFTTLDSLGDGINLEEIRLDDLSATGFEFLRSLG